MDELYFQRISRDKQINQKKMQVLTLEISQGRTQGGKTNSPKLSETMSKCSQSKKGSRMFRKQTSQCPINACWSKSSS